MWEKYQQEKEERKNCYICKHCTNHYKKTDIYMEAVAKLYEKELEPNNNEVENEY